jgi:hypothetical protein
VADRGDAWLLLELELWLHGARDGQVGAELAQRYAATRAQLGEGLADWGRTVGHPLPYPPAETGALVLGVLLGCALQHRLDPASIPDDIVVGALRTLLRLEEPPDPRGDTRSP